MILRKAKTTIPPETNHQLQRHLERNHPQWKKHEPLVYSVQGHQAGKLAETENHFLTQIITDMEEITIHPQHDSV